MGIGATTTAGRQPLARARAAAAGIAAAGLLAWATPASAATDWVPHVSDTWQWQLTGTINTGYDVTVYDIDLFDAPDAVLATLRAQGRRIVCYFSAGSAENWRPDYQRFKASDLGKPLDGWPGEKWATPARPTCARS